MKNLDLSVRELRFAVDCVRRASCLVEQVELRMVSAALEKEDKSPVTVADYAVQALIARELSEHFPSVALVAEESSEALRGARGEVVLHKATEFLAEIEPGLTPETVLQRIDRGQGRTGTHFWVLDPVDGTKGFLRGGQYAVALALVVEGEVRIGALGCPHLSVEDLVPSGRSTAGPPSRGSIVVAARGQGSWASPLITGGFFPLEVSRTTDPVRAVVLRSFESGHTNVEQMAALVRFLGVGREPIRMDSQAKYALLAAGKGDLLFRLIAADKTHYRERIWDQAAGSLIVEEAGGRITDLDGRLLDFSAGRSLENNRGILASNGALHEAALVALRSLAWIP